MADKRIFARAFSAREKVLMLLLAALMLAGAWYFVVARGTSSAYASNQATLEDLADQIAVQQAVATQRAQMEAALAALEEAGGAGAGAEVAVYDNFSAEFDQLEALLADASSFNLAFSQPVADGQLVRRQVSVTFGAADYDAALATVLAIANCPYKCLVTDFSVSAAGTSGAASSSGDEGAASQVSASVLVTFFETTKGATDLTGLA